MTPALGPIRKRNGVAGQFSYTVAVTYPDEPTREVEFVGSVYGGPVVMVTDAAQVFVAHPDRFGAFGLEWVRKFFASE